MKLILAPVLALLGGAVFAQPYYTAYQMRDAAQARDHARLSSFIDFPLVRASLKEQGNQLAKRRVEQEVGSGPLAELGGALGGIFSDKVIEATVTPESLARLLENEQRRNGSSSSGGGEGNGSDADVRFGYAAWDRFEVVSTDDDQATRMVLARQGLAWKLVAVELN